MTTPCKQEETIGTLREFMANTKGLKATMAMMAITILLQVGTFLYLWGGLTRTVEMNSKQIWENNTPNIMQNTRDIDKILEKVQAIKLIGVIGEFEKNVTK
jgi:hypothetical protein